MQRMRKGGKQVKDRRKKDKRTKLSKEEKTLKKNGGM
jgi:hypothetical protein